MAKKSGFLSWFKKGDQEPQKQPENTEQSQLVESDSAIESDANTPLANEPVSQKSDVEDNLTQDASSEAAVAEKIESVETTNIPTQTPDSGTDDSIDTIASGQDQDAAEKPELESLVAVDAIVAQDSEVTERAETLETAETVETAQEAPVEVTPVIEPKIGFFERLKRGLSKTRQQIGGGFLSLFKDKQIDDELYEELETQLLMADVGMDTTVKLINRLTDHADRNQLKDADALYGLLKSEMSDILKKSDAPLVVDNDDGPFVILMVGVNGVGKTTTIGKMAKQFQQQGKSVMLAAGDTFRAAAVEQLQVWGDRNSVPVIAQHTGADSASVIFDAYQAAKARKADVLIADTAGRLQNKDNLMQELEKIVRVLKKLDANVPHEVMLTIDATTGQNAISQTKLFNQAVGLTGISLTKLDGTAKGGVIFAVAEQFEIPIRYIGVGEGIEDLRTFEHRSFIDALFDESDN